jgi:hypothetical protein
LRAAHPLLGGLICCLRREGFSTRAFEIGAVGEQAVGRRLDGLSGRGVVAVHDRRNGHRSNIDHIAVGPSGVFVIDTKRYVGKTVRKGVSFSRSYSARLFVGNRDLTELVAKTDAQVRTVRSSLVGLEVPGAIPVVPMLVFVDADWPVWTALGRPVDVSGVLVSSPRQMERTVSRPGRFTPQLAKQIACAISDRLGPA